MSNYDRSTIDYNALNISNRVLYVFAIISVFFTSVLLLIKLWRQQNAVYNIRRLMVMVLTTGIIFLSLFSLIIRAKSSFGSNSETCRNTFLAGYYELFFFPFVYGVGLIVMACEVLFSYKRQSNPQSHILLRLGVIGIPWMLALVVVLPLLLVGVDFENCTNKLMTLSRKKAFYWVCHMVPIFIIGACAAIMLYAIKHSNIASTSNSGSTTGGFVITYPGQNQQAVVYGQGQQYQLPKTQQSYPVVHQTTQDMSATQEQINQGQPGVPQSSSVVLRNFRNEAVTIICSAAVFFLGTFPHTLYNLAYVFNTDRITITDPAVALALECIVYWLSVGRWVGINVTWLIFWR